MADFWYCVCTLLNPLHLILYIKFFNGRLLTSFPIQNRCGYGPHNPELHLACIMCGTRCNMSFSTESSDVRATDLLNPSKVRPRELKVEFYELQNDFSDDCSDGCSDCCSDDCSQSASALASQFSAPLSRQRDCRPPSP